MAKYKLNGVDYDVEVKGIEENIAKVNVNGTEYEVELAEAVKAQPKKVKIEAPKPAAAPVPAAAPAAKPAAATGEGAKVVAPLPGTITEMCVKVGDTVNVGDTVVVLEAMKMQNNIEAETAGKVTSVLVNKGDSVMEGDALLTIG